MMMDRKIFYAELRKQTSGVFGKSLSQKQVDGLEQLLNVWESYFLHDKSYGIDELAYDLGTAYHETGATMQPIMERGKRAYFNKYEPGTRIGKILGNTQPGDGFRFRGAGHVQNTGRRNAGVASTALSAILGRNVNLVNNPEQRLNPLYSALSLFIGNHEGWWTGRALDDYLDNNVEDEDEDVAEFVKARAVVNGRDRAVKIANYSYSFLRALIAAGYNDNGPVNTAKGPLDMREQQGEKIPVPAKKPAVHDAVPPAPPGKSLIGVIFEIIGKLLGGK